MQAYGRKKGHSHVAGHQQCGICHPVQKNKTARGRVENKLEVEEQLDMKVSDETREEMIARWEKEGYLDPTCLGCKEYYEYPGMPTGVFAPRHSASTRCESGKRPHCTCDTCF